MTRKTFQFAVGTIAIAILGVTLRAADPVPTTAATEPTTKPVDPKTVVIRFGDQQITAGEFDEFIAELPAEYQSMAHGAMKRRIAEDLVKIKIMSAEANKRKLGETAKFQHKMQLMREQMLAGALFEEMSSKTDDTELKKYYEAHKGEMEEIQARHILIGFEGSPAVDPAKKPPTEAEAKAKADAICARLAKGEDFAAIAKAESDDKGSGSRGGDLGTFKKGQMVPPFEEAAFALKVNEVSQPVKTRFGYHIIQVQKHNTPTFEEAKPKMAEEMGPKLAQDAVDALQKAADPKFDDSFFPKPASRPAHPFPLPEGMDEP